MGTHLLHIDPKTGANAKLRNCAAGLLGWSLGRQGMGTRTRVLDLGRVVTRTRGKVPTIDRSELGTFAA